MGEAGAMSGSDWHLAQINIGRLVAPQGYDQPDPWCMGNA